MRFRHVVQTPALLLLFVLVCSSCSTAPNGADASKETCIDDSYAKPALQKLGTFLDAGMATMEGRKASDFQLIEDKCWKRTYLKSGRQVVLYKHLDGPASEMKLATSSGAGDAAAKKACIAAATQTLRRSDAQLIDAIFQKHQSLQADFFGDLDVGPVKWLKCQDRASIDWYESLGTMLHETNHENRVGDCVYSPFQKAPQCFEFEQGMPRRAYAALETFPVRDAASVAKLKMIQKVYLTDMDEPFVMILEELNSYTVTLRAMDRLIQSEGVKSHYPAGEDRQGVLVPLFQVYAIRYLDRLLESNRPQFERVFLQRPANLNRLKTILKDSEIAYREWEKTLKKIGKLQKGAEIDLRAHYFAIKKVLDLKLVKMGVGEI